MFHEVNVDFFLLLFWPDLITSSNDLWSILDDELPTFGLWTRADLQSCTSLISSDVYKSDLMIWTGSFDWRPREGVHRTSRHGFRVSFHVSRKVGSTFRLSCKEREDCREDGKRRRVRWTSLGSLLNSRIESNSLSPFHPWAMADGACLDSYEGPSSGSRRVEAKIEAPAILAW